MQRAGTIHVSDEVLEYLHQLVETTRANRQLELGLSTRAAIAGASTPARALALLVAAPEFQRR